MDNEGRVAREFISWEQACAAVAMLREDTALPYRYDNACGAKTEYMLGALCRSGVSMQVLGRALNVLPDISAEATKAAYESGSSGMMHHAEPYQYPRFSERAEIAKLLDGGESADGVVDCNWVRFEVDMRGGICVTPRSPRGAEHWVGDAGYHFHCSNHIMPTLQVENPQTGSVETMVVDLACDTQGPVTLVQWKRSQNFESSVVTTAALGERYEIEASCSSDTGMSKLAGILRGGSFAAKKLDQSELSALSAAQHDVLMGEFLHFDSKAPHDILSGDLLSDNQRMREDWPHLSHEEREEKTQFFEDNLHPLATYQQWAIEVDAKISLMKEAASQVVGHDVQEGVSLPDANNMQGDELEQGGYQQEDGTLHAERTLFKKSTAKHQFP